MSAEDHQSVQSASRLQVTRSLAFLLAVDICLAVLFYVQFFPKTLVVQAAAAVGLATAVLSLLGLKLAQERVLSAVLSTRRIARSAIVAFFVLAALLLIGILRPFEVVTVPGASVSVDGKPYGAAPASEVKDASGFSVAKVYTSWEEHEFGVQKRYFVDNLGEVAPRRTATWFQAAPRPRVDLRLRACLARKQGGEWPHVQMYDLETGVGWAPQHSMLFSGLYIGWREKS